MIKEENLDKLITPEEAELFSKKTELEQNSAILAEMELDLEDLRLSLARFQHRYFNEIGKKYVQLDDLRAQIAEHRALHTPQDFRTEVQSTHCACRSKQDCQGLSRQLQRTTFKQELGIGGHQETL